MNPETTYSTIHRTPAAACPACAEQRLHSANERGQHHPLSGHGFNGSHWSEERLAAERRLVAAQINTQQGGPR